MVAPDPTSPPAAPALTGALPAPALAPDPAAAPGRHTRRSRWRRRVTVPAAEPPAPAFTEDGRPLIVVTPTDFVACSYKGCGTLRPLEEVTVNAPCAGCGRR